MLIQVEHGRLVFGQQAKAACDFLIGFHFAAQIAAETVLVHLVAGLHVPKAAAIRADLVGQDDTGKFAIEQPAELQLEIHKADADGGEHAGHEVIHADRHVGDIMHLVLAGPAEGGDMLIAHQGIAERIILVIIFDDGARQLGAFLDAEALGDAAGSHVAHHHLDRDDLHLAHQLLAHVEAADEVGGDADHAEQREDMFGNAVVQHALAADRALLLGIEGGGIILEILDDGAGFRTFIQDLGLAFINLAAAGHGKPFEGGAASPVQGRSRLKFNSAGAG